MIVATFVTQWRPELLLRGFIQRPGHDCRGCLVPENSFAESRRAGFDLCVLECVSGPGQYDAAAHQFDPAPDNICDPDLMVVGAIRFPRRTHLVPLHHHDHDAGAAQSLVAAPRAPETAGISVERLELEFPTSRRVVHFYVCPNAKSPASLRRPGFSLQLASRISRACASGS